MENAGQTKVVAILQISELRMIGGNEDGKKRNASKVKTRKESKHLHFPGNSRCKNKSSQSDTMRSFFSFVKEFFIAPYIRPSDYERVVPGKEDYFIGLIGRYNAAIV